MAANSVGQEMDDDTDVYFEGRSIEEDYLTLGLSAFVSDSQLKKQWKRAMRKVHPDRTQHPADKVMCAQINQAYTRIKKYRATQTKEELNFEKEYECMNPAVATDTFEIHKETRKMREFSRGEHILLDKHIERTEDGRMRARCKDGWVSLQSMVGLTLFAPVMYKLEYRDEDQPPIVRKDQRVTQSSRSMFGGLKMTCISTVSFTRTHAPEPFVIHRAYKDECLNVYDVVRHGPQTRVKSDMGWVSFVNQKGVPLLKLDDDFAYGLLKAQTEWRRIFVYRQVEKKKKAENEEKLAANESVQDKLNLSGTR